MQALIKQAYQRGAITDDTCDRKLLLTVAEKSYAMREEAQQAQEGKEAHSQRGGQENNYLSEEGIYGRNYDSGEGQDGYDDPGMRYESNGQGLG